MPPPPPPPDDTLRLLVEAIDELRGAIEDAVDEIGGQSNSSAGGGSPPGGSPLDPGRAHPIPTAIPVAAAVDPFRLLLESLAEVKGAIEKNLARPLKEVNRDTTVSGSAFAQLRKSIGGALPAEFANAGKAAAMFGATLKSLGAAGMVVSVAADAIAGLGQQMAHFVRSASPGTVMLFNNVLEDMNAVIGQALKPVLEVVTVVARTFADTLTLLVPIGGAVALGLKPLVGAFGAFMETIGRVFHVVRRLADQLAPMWNAMSGAIYEVMKAIQPLVDLLIDGLGAAMLEVQGVFVTALTTVVPYVSAFARAMADFIAWMVKGTRVFLAMLGISLPDESGSRPGGSVGAAAKSANIGSVDSALQKALTSAFSMGTGASDPAVETASAAKALAAKANEIYGEIKKSVEWLEKISTAVSKTTGGASDVVKRVSPVAGGVGVALANADEFAAGNFGFASVGGAATALRRRIFG